MGEAGSAAERVSVRHVRRVAIGGLDLEEVAKQQLHLADVDVEPQPLLRWHKVAAHRFGEGMSAASHRGGGVGGGGGEGV